MTFQIHNRRYIGSKASLAPWIFDSIPKEFKSGTFFDAFAGTGVVSAGAAQHFQKIVLNDLLYSNEAIYKAFFGTGKIDWAALEALPLAAKKLAKKPNFFGEKFGGRYFDQEAANLVGAYRLAIDQLFPNEKDRNRFVALASLIYSADRSAITVGHYEAYLKTGKNRTFEFELIEPLNVRSKLFRGDANIIAERVVSDVAYLDPPYNSRQYSRFYHVLETLTKWDNPELFGVALKPPPENISDYCKRAAPGSLQDLISKLDTRFIVISYNNTYNSKSTSSQNKITLEEIEVIARSRGKVKILELPHKHFNAGKTQFKDHREFLFTVKVKD
jgi:adenine-specific DNA-methyltransferase